MRGDPIKEVPLTMGEHLMGALVAVGLCSQSAMGDPIPVSWSELWAYGMATKAGFAPWEYETLADMSRAYVAGLHLGRDEVADAPYAGDDDG